MGLGVAADADAEDRHVNPPHGAAGQALRAIPAVGLACCGLALRASRGTTQGADARRST